MARNPNGAGRKDKGQKRSQRSRVRPVGYVAPTFEGKPCKLGHTTRYVSAPSVCVECSRNKHHDNAEKAMWLGAKRSARERGLEFDIEVTDIQIPEVCPVLGLQLFRSRGFRTANSPSLDRIDNDQGYVKGNIAVISLRANQLKNNATAEELKKIVAYMESNGL